MRIGNKRVLIILSAVVVVFFFLYLFKSLSSMRATSFNEFDEAHRAETAKRMMQYGSFLVPISGSPYDRVIPLHIQMKNDSFKSLYYHLERPPLVYDLMIVSGFFFGSSSEFGYRFPSFILGMLTLVVFLLFAKILFKKINPWALIISIVSLITSNDLWLSSQYAQLDTGLTVFLFLSILSIITFVEKKQNFFLIVSAVSFGLAILSKGQPAVYFIPVLIFLVISKKISWRSVFTFMGWTSIVVLPWFLYMGSRFGFDVFIGVFAQFAFLIRNSDIIHHKAPFFWYARWWLETLRPGWFIFVAFFVIDLLRKTFDSKKSILLSYIIFNFVFLSVQSDKLWWYVLPLVPTVCFYIFISLQDYLEKKYNLINLSLAIIIASRPPIANLSNTSAMIFGLFIMLAVFYILHGLNISKVDSHLRKLPTPLKGPNLIFVSAIVFSLFSFYTRFPKIIPYNYAFKPASYFFASLPQRKCLWSYDIPVESVLFYSNTGEAYDYEPETPRYFGHCQNYLMTDIEFSKLHLVWHQGDIKLYKLKHN